MIPCGKMLGRALVFKRAAYFADFVVCPAAIAALFAQAWRVSPQREAGDFGVALAVGVLAWTLAEYLLHRFVLHVLPPFRRLHELHHAAPRDLVGTPVWLSAALLFALFALMNRFEDATVACGVTAGVSIGYLAYVSLHCAVHHLPGLSWAWLRRLRRAHAVHHRSASPCNFGVSTPLWDVLFGTGAGDGPHPACPTTRDG